MTDPTRIRNQASLTTSTGAVWLIVGGLFALIAVAVLATLVSLQPPGLAIAGIVAVVVLYLAMLVIRFSVSRPRLRLGLLAACMLGMAAISLTCTIVVSVVEWGSV